MKNWFSIYDQQIYSGNEPSFYNPENYGWAQLILKNKDVIINEFYNVTTINNKLFDAYFNQKLTSKVGSWKTISLKFWNVNIFKNHKYFPDTINVLNQIPNLVSASFNKLESGTKIGAHCGDTNGIYRCHLGIEIPAGLPDCGFEVNNVKKAWANNELLIFCDAHLHQAWNDTEKDRYIFLFDVIREDGISEKRNIISTVLAALFLQKIALIIGYSKIEKINRKNFKPLVFILKPFALLAVWFTNKFKVY